MSQQLPPAQQDRIMPPPHLPRPVLTQRVKDPIETIKYENFLKEQDSILNHIKDKKDYFKAWAENVLTGSKEKLISLSENIFDYKETIENGTSNIIKIINDSTKKINEKSNEQIKELEEIINILNDFTRNYNKKTQPSYEELSRDVVKQNINRYKDLTEQHKAVINQTYGGKRRKRKTVKRRKINK